MKILYIVSFLIVSCVATFAQADSASAKSQAKSITTQKVVVVNESSQKSLNRIIPKNKTTWSKIKNMFM